MQHCCSAVSERNMSVPCPTGAVSSVVIGEQQLSSSHCDCRTVYIAIAVTENWWFIYLARFCL